jgi:hypothetical protein
LFDFKTPEIGQEICGFEIEQEGRRFEIEMTQLRRGAPQDFSGVVA